MKCVRISRDCSWSQVISITSHRRNWPVAKAQRSPSLPSSPLPSLPSLSTLSLTFSLTFPPSVFSWLNPTILLCSSPFFQVACPILPLGSQTWQMTNSHRGERTGSVWQSAGVGVGTTHQYLSESNIWVTDPKPSLKIPRDTPQP